MQVRLDFAEARIGVGTTRIAVRRRVGGVKLGAVARRMVSSNPSGCHGGCQGIYRLRYEYLRLCQRLKRFERFVTTWAILVR
jgi:hypothetical protein